MYNTLDAVLLQWHRPEEILKFPQSKTVSLLLLSMKRSSHIKDLKYCSLVIITDESISYWSKLGSGVLEDKISLLPSFYLKYNACIQTCYLQIPCS